MNSMTLQDLVKGKYGRKIAYANVEEVDQSNILEIVGETLGIFYFNKRVIKYLWDYYKGDHPIRYRKKIVRDDIVNKIVENHAYEIVQFKTGQTYGEPIQFISKKDDEKINKGVDELNDYLADANKHEKDIKGGEWQSAVGTSFRAVQFSEDDEIPFRIIAPSPMNTYIIYSSITEEPLVAVQELKDTNGEFYKVCYTKSHQCILKNGKVEKWELHAFGDIPIIEYPNNHERISDIELVVDLMDAIDNMQSNRMDSIEQFVQSWVKFVNCTVDPETFHQMKLEGALVVKSNNGTDNKADVDIMTQELNQSQSQVAKDDLWDNAQIILAIPNRNNNNTGGDTQGAIQLRNGWDEAKNRTIIKDPLIRTSEKRLAKVVLNILRIKGNDLGITLRDFSVQINHSPTDNMVVKCQSLQYLLECGIHPLIAIKTVGLWGDAEKVFMISKDYLDNLWKKIGDAEEQEAKAQELLDNMNQNQNQNSNGDKPPEVEE